MSYHGVVTRAAFEEALPPEQLRVTQILQLVIMAGPLLFALVVFAMSLQRQGMEEPGGDTGFLWVLTLLHLAYTVAVFLAGHFVMQRLVSPGRLSGDTSRDDARTLALKCLALHRTATIIRLALLESAAFFGLTICLLAVFNGVLPAESKYWINLVSTVVLVLFALFTLPTKERIGDVFEKQFLN